MWFRVDDQFHLHPKAQAAGNAALGLWVQLGSWAAERRRGEIPMRVALTFGTRAQLDRLVNVGLLERNGAAAVAMHEWQYWQGPVTDAERARAYRQRKASGITKRDAPRDERASRKPSRREDRRPTPPDDLTTDDDDEVVPRRRASRNVTQSSSSSIDAVVKIAAQAIGIDKGNTRSDYVRGIVKNLRAERLDEIETALSTEPDPIRAAGVIVGSHVAARNAARDLNIDPRTRSRSESSSR